MVEFSAITLVSLLIIAAVGSLIVVSHVQASSGVCIDIARPLPFYGSFYFMYYLLPFLLLAFSGQLPEGNQISMALLLLVGYVACGIGMICSKVKKGGFSPAWLGEREAQALLAFCVVGIGLVVYVYAWRTSQGVFFNHARYFEQDLTVEASFRDVFCMNLQLPLILLLGLLSAVPYQSVGVPSRVLFWSYGIGMTTVLVLSSQTRPAVTALIFFLIGLRFHRSLTIRFHHILLLVTLCFAIMLAVQVMRVVDVEEFASSENQFLHAVQHIVPNVLAGMTEAMPDITESVTSRAGGGISFLSNVIDAINEGKSHLYGEGISVSLYSLIPRFLWEDKPQVTSPQLVAEELLNMPILFDAAQIM